MGEPADVGSRGRSASDLQNTRQMLVPRARKPRYELSAGVLPPLGIVCRQQPVGEPRGVSREQSGPMCWRFPASYLAATDCANQVLLLSEPLLRCV